MEGEMNGRMDQDISLDSQDGVENENSLSDQSTIKMGSHHIQGSPHPQVIHDIHGVYLPVEHWQVSVAIPVFTSMSFLSELTFEITKLHICEPTGIGILEDFNCNWTFIALNLHHKMPHRLA